MEIRATKAYLKANKITYEQLSERSGIPLNTLKNIFSERTQNPRIDTIKAIEAALGFEKTTEKSLKRQDTQTNPIILSERHRSILACINRADEALGVEYVNGFLSCLEIQADQKIKEKK